jgi:GST-like protein
MTTTSPYRLLGQKGYGSVIAEAAFALAGIGIAIEDLDYETPGPDRDRLLALNPLGQVPTLILPDGAVMTESAAIVLHVADLAPEAGLVPALDDPDRPRFLRWLVFLVSAVYPTFTYGDLPERWVPADAAPLLKESTNRHRESLWRQVEAELDPSPWLLGERFSALDLYVCAMSRWRPRRDWFAAACPKLHRVALAVDALPALRGVWARNAD